MQGGMPANDAIKVRRAKIDGLAHKPIVFN
jgi:hypothetical protein